VHLALLIMAAAQAPDPARSHWAFRPPAETPVPTVARADWVKTPVDAFVLHRLEAAGLAPSGPADKSALLRRVAFDLTGLGPTAEEIDAFVADESSDAYERAVERLLASPRYGERWGRHWLDVARYADTRGYLTDNKDRRYPWAYVYRDWVIRAFNEDLPYDRFILLQIAADRIVGDADRRDLAAMGFLTVGRRFIDNFQEIVDDRIDVVTRGLMGLTVHCARCHSHKYDPIPIEDYYSLYGVFSSSVEPADPPEIPRSCPPEWAEAYEREVGAARAQIDETKAKRLEQILAPLRRPEQIAAYREAAREGLERDAKGLESLARERKLEPFFLKRWVEHLKKDPPPEEAPPDPSFEQIGPLLTDEDRKRLESMERKVRELTLTHPGAPPRAMVLNDGKRPRDAHVLIRGSRDNPGPVVPRRFLAVLSGPERPAFNDGSGRLELARAIASPDNPLTARVWVNRVWMHLTGGALVPTPSDFGTRCEPPTHPELLDWLARRFVADGWSTKRLHRHIVLSNTYRQAADERAVAGRVDPQNRLLWRMNRRRLDWESMRDALLAVAGELDPTMGGPSVELTTAPFSRRRTVYGRVERQNLAGVFRTFDFAGPDLHCPMRFTTTVPQQALFLMNSPFVQERARALAARSAPEADPAARAQRLYRLALGRSPDETETEAALRFVASEPKEPWERLAQTLLMTNEFNFVD
jgi:hypothetical protein